MLPTEVLLRIVAFLSKEKKSCVLTTLLKLGLIKRVDIAHAMSFSVTFNDEDDEPSTTDYLERMRMIITCFRGVARMLTVGPVASPYVRSGVMSVFSSPHLRRVEVPAMKPFLRAVGRCVTLKHITIVVRRGDRSLSAFEILTESPPLENVREVEVLFDPEVSGGKKALKHIGGCVCHFLVMFELMMFAKFPEMLHFRTACCPHQSLKTM